MVDPGGPSLAALVGWFDVGWSGFEVVEVIEGLLIYEIQYRYITLGGLLNIEKTSFRLERFLFLFDLKIRNQSI